ncbi:hypothetical protein BsWGS_11029 [Bradybaena similaris]
MLNWPIDSPSLYVSSSTASTPVRRSSQDAFANIYVDSVVPRTPSITNNQYRSDQCVPHTPGELTVATSPLIPTAGTPLTNLDVTSPSRYSILYFDNQDDNPANETSIDQTVPSTPTSMTCEPYIQVNSGDPASNRSSVLNGNSDSIIGDAICSESTVAQSNIVTKHLRSTTRKQLSLRKSDNSFANTTVNQTLPSKKAYETQWGCSSSNTGVVLSIPEYSSRPTKETCYTISGRIATPADHGLPQSILNEPAATALSCSPYTPPSDSLAAPTASTSSVSPPLPVTHAREMRLAQRPFAQTEEARHCQRGQKNVPNNSTQLQLFDGDDIF